MDQAQQDIFAKLEAAIEKWSAEVAEAQTDLTREVARAKGLAKGEEGTAVQGRPSSGAAAIMPSSLEPLVQLFRESFEALRENGARLSRWEDTAERLYSEVDGLKTALSRPPEPDSRVADRLEALREQVAQLEDRQPQGLELEEEKRLAGQVENLRAELGLIREIVAGTPELDHGVADEIRSLRADLGQIRENTAHVRRLEERVEALPGLLQSALAQLELHPAQSTSEQEMEEHATSESEAEPPLAVEETVEVGADADLSADLASFEEPTEEEGAGLPGAEEEGAGLPGAEEEPVDAKGTGSRFQAFGPDGSRRRLGEILLAAKVVSQDQLDRALAAQENSPQKHLGALLIEMGLTGEDVIAQTLACQVGLRYVKLDPETIDPNAARLIPSRMALRHKCIAVEAEDDRVAVAMANPLDLIAIEDVERATNMTLEPLVASSGDIMSAIEWCYGSSSSEI